MASITNKWLLAEPRLTTAMRRSFILLCVISRASLETQAIRHFFMAHNEKPYSYPIKSGYVFKHVNNQPPMILSYGNKRGRDRTFADIETKLADATPMKKSTSDTNKYSNQKRSKPVVYEAVKNIENDTLIRNPKREAVFEDKEPRNTLLNYEKYNDFLNDDEDVRTESLNSYDGWPFFYRSHYEYEPMKFYREIEKAKDKRFLREQDKRVIPVQEHIKDDVVDNRVYNQPDAYSKRILTTDNPMFGEQPFFSYVLNDYFDKTHDYDPLSFKGFPWGKEFDQEISSPNMNEYSRNFRRFNDDLPKPKKVYGSSEDPLKKYSHKTKERNDNNIVSESEENEQDEEENQNRQSYRNFRGDNDIGFKEFADYFANRFGSEDLNNIYKINDNKNIDKGEKKKGFRKVYHKDEYQEETEFHDHNNQKANLINNGEFKTSSGGYEKLSKTQGAAAAGSNKTNAGYNVTDEMKTHDKSKKSEHQQNNESNIKQYRDVAKDAVMSNNADYIDNYMT